MDITYICASSEICMYRTQFVCVGKHTFNRRKFY